MVYAGVFSADPRVGGGVEARLGRGSANGCREPVSLNPESPAILRGVHRGSRGPRVVLGWAVLARSERIARAGYVVSVSRPCLFAGATAPAVRSSRRRIRVQYHHGARQAARAPVPRRALRARPPVAHRPRALEHVL